jgi:transcriptional regulator with XRE-family HTH domain
MPQPTREGRHDADWTPEDFNASNNLRRVWLTKAPTLGLSQNKLSRQWKISQGAISRYINGILRLNPETILKFAVVLDVPPEYIDPRINQLMRTKKTEYLHAIVIKTQEYEPRIFMGDWISLDVLNNPKPGKLVAAHMGDQLLIGYYTDHSLKHPTTGTLQPIPDKLLVHNISGIIPGGNL